MSGKKLVLPVLILIMGIFIFILTGCGALERLGLPEPPAFPSATAEPTPTPRPTATRKPAATPKPTATAKPAASPAPTATAAPEPSAAASPAATASPTAAPTVAPAAAAPQVNAAAAAPVIYRSPAITIENQTLPSDMTQGSVFSLGGIVRCDCGILTYVTGTIYHGSGEAAQQTTYYSGSDYFSLLGSINNDLRFGILKPDTYIYQVVAKAENGTAASETILINHAFTVTARSSAIGSAPSGSYTAKTTDDTDNAALIWNFFIDRLHNPYAAAAILGNIRSESSCDPARVEGDISGSFSAGYTAQVDSGALSRDQFTDNVPGEKYGHGYGLCQWSGERKGALYDLAVSRGSSVGDLTTQCEFIMQELENEYTTLLEYLRTADDAEAAAFEFCTVYEKAAVHGGRTTFAQEYLDKYAA